MSLKCIYYGIVFIRLGFHLQPTTPCTSNPLHHCPASLRLFRNIYIYFFARLLFFSLSLATFGFFPFLFPLCACYYTDERKINCPVCHLWDPSGLKCGSTNIILCCWKIETKYCSFIFRCHEYLCVFGNIANRDDVSLTLFVC